MDKCIRIEVYLSPTCPSRAQLEENLKLALELEGLTGDIKIEVIDKDEANRRGFKGSPTILIEGREFQPLELGGFS